MLYYKAMKKSIQSYMTENCQMYYYLFILLYVIFLNLHQYLSDMLAPNNMVRRLPLHWCHLHCSCMLLMFSSALLAAISASSFSLSWTVLLEFSGILSPAAFKKCREKKGKMQFKLEAKGSKNSHHKEFKGYSCFGEQILFQDTISSQVSISYKKLTL